MSEYIKKTSIIGLANKLRFGRILTEREVEVVEMVVNDVPAADVAPVRHGRWIDDKVSFYLGCSECGCFLEYAVDTFLDNGDHYNYCPNCGARMDGGAEDEVD